MRQVNIQSRCFPYVPETDEHACRLDVIELDDFREIIADDFRVELLPTFAAVRARTKTAFTFIRN
jgi:hypothetical protein